MSDFPSVRRPMLPVISTFSALAAGQQRAAMAQAFVSAAVTTVSNEARYLPIAIPAAFLLKAFWWYNGASVSGNVDIGLYSRNGGKVASTGSTAQSGTSTIQSVTLGTAVLLQPGLHYLAWCIDNTTGTMVQSNVGVEPARRFGMHTQTSAFALPSTATFASTASGRIPILGIASRTTI